MAVYRIQGTRGSQTITIERPNPSATFATVRRLTALGWDTLVTILEENGGVVLAKLSYPSSERRTIPAPYVSCDDEIETGWAERPRIEFPTSERYCRVSETESSPTIPCPPFERNGR